MVSRPVFRAAIGAAAALFLTSCAGAPAAEGPTADPGDAAFPVEVTSCGHTSTVTTRPERVVTLNQGATEVVLALGLEDQLVGTAYLDDEIPEKWRAAYESVPVLSAEYPTTDDLVAAQPDFLYASYASAFERGVAGSRADLAAEGTPTYLSPFGCADAARQPESSFEAVWDELDAVASSLGAAEASAELRVAQRRQLDVVKATAAGEGLDVLWFDSGDRTPFVGAGGGGPQLVLDAVGATNIFADLSGGWANGNWEDVVVADPDVIVIADATWSPAADKIAYLEDDPVLGDLTAVRENAYVIVPFAETTPGVRLVDGASSVSEQLSSLVLR